MEEIQSNVIDQAAEPIRRAAQQSADTSNKAFQNNALGRGSIRHICGWVIAKLKQKHIKLFRASPFIMLKQQRWWIMLSMKLII